MLASKRALRWSSEQTGGVRLVSKGCKLVGCGSAVPSLQVSNDDLAKVVDTSDEWMFALGSIIDEF
ncbi:hypothetical protein ACSBR1_026212 [Camellia fascicularis]